MKYLIASDIHGSAGCCERLLQAFEREKADRLLLLGDLLYHGPRNDLPEGFGPKGVMAQLNAYKDRIFAVRGNCDADIDLEVLEFGIFEPVLYLREEGLTVAATHGHIYGENRPPKGLEPGSVVLGGHTHIPALKDYGTYLYMNPGSASLPKGGSEKGYMFWEGRSFQWKTLDGVLFRSYEAESRA